VRAPSAIRNGRRACGSAARHLADPRRSPRATTRRVRSATVSPLTHHRRSRPVSSAHRRSWHATPTSRRRPRRHAHPSPPRQGPCANSHPNPLRQGPCANSHPNPLRCEDRPIRLPSLRRRPRPCPKRFPVRPLHQSDAHRCDGDERACRAPPPDRRRRPPRMVLRTPERRPRQRRPPPKRSRRPTCNSSPSPLNGSAKVPYVSARTEFRCASSTRTALRRRSADGER
jgi:hypothetical protein